MYIRTDSPGARNNVLQVQIHILYTREESHLIDDRLQKLFCNVFNVNVFKVPNMQ